jgi:hypothetical protein
MNENKSTNEQPNDTGVFKLPKKTLNDKINEVYNISFRGSSLYAISTFVFIATLLKVISFLLEQLRYTLFHLSTLTTFVISPIGSTADLISTILISIFVPIAIIAYGIHNNERIDRNYEKCVNHLRNQQPTTAQKHVTTFNIVKAALSYETLKRYYTTDVLNSLSDKELHTLYAVIGFMEFIINCECLIKDGEVFDIRGLLFVSYRSIAEIRPLNAETATAIQYVTTLLQSLYLDIEE